MSVLNRSRSVRKPLSEHFLANEYSTRNVMLASDVGVGSKAQVWWVCAEGHEWEASVEGRVNSKRGCPYCSGQKPVVGVNDLATVNPVLGGEFHPVKNEVLLESLTGFSNRKVWWLGECGHEWVASVVNRSKGGQGCPYCSGQKVLVGFNDFGTAHPKLVGSWDFEKNIDLMPEQLSSGSNRKVWWLCEFNHSWLDSVNHRTSGRGCPVCAGKQVMPGFNDVATTHPHKVVSWDYERNGELLPSMVSAGSHQMAWWKCGKEHEWYASVANRVLNNGEGTSCPECLAHTYVSKPEKDLSEFLAGLGVAVQTSVRNMIKGELDIYVPEKKVAVEFNGLYWHSEAAGKTKNYHRDKWLACKNQGIQLIQVWEDDWNRNPDLIKRMLTHKLRVTVQPKVYARDTVFVEVSSAEAREFLEANHLQGYRAAKYFGLLSNEKVLVSILGVQKSGGKSLELIRFASSVPVPGGFSKLLKNISQLGVYSEVDHVISYSHNDYSDGGVYEGNGFELSHNGVPGYSYWKSGWEQRKNRLLFSPQALRKSSDFEFVEGLTERELATLNGLTRVWDSGSSLWVKRF